MSGPHGGDSGAAPDAAPQVLTARPILMTRIGYAGAVFVLAVFILVALLMKRDNAGVHFAGGDQWATVIIGVILAGLCLMPTRPRLHADLHAVRMRSFLGGWRTVGWDSILAVQFPRKARFARVVLPGDEIFALYAVQRVDGEAAVQVMRELRALAERAQRRPAAGQR